MNERCAPPVEHSYAVFTVCNLAYLHRAAVLAKSLEAFGHPKLKIYIFDRKISLDTSELPAEIFWIEELGIADFSQLAFKYDIIELSTSLKPYITLRLLNEVKKVIFLDPDTWLLHSIAPILDDLDQHDILLTPHYTTPQPDNPAESDLGMMRFGSFNLGFFGVRLSDESLSFLSWWSARCLRFCYMESQFGLSTDQKWVSIAPCLFQSLHISFNQGYNVAPWNIRERHLSRREKGGYLVNGRYPLVFFHFSNFNREDPEYRTSVFVFDRAVARPDVLDIGSAYLRALSIAETQIPKVDYAFDYMSKGEYISPTLRRAYACILSELPSGHDPFDSGGIVARFAKRNGLFERRGNTYRPKGFRDVDEHRKAIDILYALMRLGLRLIGPNRFMNLSRLLVFLSSYRQNRGLWKY